MTTSNKNQVQSFLFSTAGVVVMLVILVAVYIITGVVKVRMDLTQERLYTLSTGTKAILEKLAKSETPVQINFYCTQDSKDMPVQLKTYGQRVEELLEEYRKASRGNIEVKKFDPKPDTEAEDSANLDGVQGQAVGGGLGMGDKVYLGLAIHQLDAKETIAFLAPDREKLLEYDISRAISRVTTPQKAVVGVMSALPVYGEVNPMAMRMGNMQRQDPWLMVGELKQDFDVKQVDMNVEEIPADIKVLVVIHPKNISNKAQYAIDQFVLGGGKLIAFLDPYSMVDSQNQRAMNMNPMQAAQQGGSNMELLLKAWGLTFDANKVVADMKFLTRVQGQQGGVQQMPAVLTMTPAGMNSDDIATSQTDSLLIPFAGAFSGTPADGLKQTVLLHTSTASQQIDRFMAEYSGDQTAKDFSSSGKELPIAIRLTGKFKTAFPDGKPKDSAPKPEDDKKDEPKTEDKPSLKESTSENNVVLLGDSDMIYDHFCARVQNFFGQKIVSLPNGNLPLAQSLIEQFAGDSNLIKVRSRATMNRPFTVVRDMQASAQDRYRAKISELEKSLQETQTKLNEMQRTKAEAGNQAGSQRFVLSPEQQKEIKNFQDKQANVNKELRVVRRSLNKDIDSLESRLKWMNIAGMPMLVAISGISLATMKRKKTAAK